MFDDNAAQKPLDDIFSGTDPSADQSIPTSASPRPAVIPSTPALGVMPEGPKRGRGPLIIAIVIVVTVVVLGAVLVGLILVRRQQPETVTPAQQAQTVPTTQAPQQPAVVTPEQPMVTEETQPTPSVDEPVDTDGDGLTDDVEMIHGTSVSQADTDADGLSDAEEVRVWNTNPTNPDTDGDGFNDGQEVQGNYDPNQGGGARLIDELNGEPVQ